MASAKKPRPPKPSKGQKRAMKTTKQRILDNRGLSRRKKTK